MKIGSIAINPPLALAPMAGVTDQPYREIVAEVGGCGLIYTEMVSAKGLVYGNQRTEELLSFTDKERPIAVQLFGNEPKIIKKAAAKIENEYSPDIIDLNVGCPAPKIVNNGYGSALMKEPDLLGKIVSAMTSAVCSPVTVKIRAGWDKERINAVKIAKKAVESGAQAVGVHGRTREQFYEGEADWEIIRAVKEVVSVPVLGNGDVFTPQAGEEMLHKTGCDGVLIARAARGNPWIFKRTAQYIKTGEKLSVPGAHKKTDKALIHLKKLVEYKGEYVGIREMRKHAAWYLKGLRNCTKVKAKLNQAESEAEMKKILRSYQATFKE